MFLVDKEIASASEEFFKGDTCQVRPMARCPSVPPRINTAILQVNCSIFLGTFRCKTIKNPS